jgi:hypothetical protein
LHAFETTPNQKMVNASRRGQQNAFARTAIGKAVSTVGAWASQGDSTTMEASRVGFNCRRNGAFAALGLILIALAAPVIQRLDSAPQLALTPSQPTPVGTSLKRIDFLRADDPDVLREGVRESRFVTDVQVLDLGLARAVGL